LLTADRRDDDGVWPDHVAALRAFLAVQSQWRVTLGPRGCVHHGLDYAGAEAGLRLAGIDPDPDLWTQVRIIESGAEAALNEA